MDVSKRQVGDVTILDLKGKITIGTGDVQLRNAVQDVMNSGATKVLIHRAIKQLEEEMSGT